MLSDFRAPYRDHPFHHSYTGGITEIFYQIAWPFVALMTGIMPFRFYTIPDRTGFTITIKLSGRIRLHAAKTFGFFRFCSKEVGHHSPEFLILISCRNVHSAGTTIQPTGCHQTFISNLFFSPSFHTYLTSCRILS